MRAGELFTRMGQQPGGHGMTVTDADLDATCSNCRTRQRLSESRVLEEGDQTKYFCKQGCSDALVTITAKGNDQYALQPHVELGLQVQPKG